MDELWFTLDADLLRIALGIIPKDPAHPFVAPPSGDLVIDFKNNLGYPEELQFVSKMYVNSLYQPWRSILSMINQCLMGKTSGSDKPRHLVLQMLWGVVTGTNADFAKLLIPTRYCKPSDDYTLDNFKFVPNGELDEVFGMAIPKDLLTNAIRNAKYYHKYLEMAACKPCQPTAVTDEESVKKKKVPPTDKSKKHAPAKQTKHVKEKSTKPTPSKKASKGIVLKVQNGKRSDHLVDKEDEEPQPAPEPQIEDDEYTLQRGIQMNLELFQAPVDGVDIREPTSGITRSLSVVEGKGKGIATDEQATQSLLELQQPKKKSTTDEYIF
ncbi:hypothetical protein Tco_0642182 [Tanacetum coccineum]